MFGNPETTTGGMALKFYASVRLDVRRIERVTEYRITLRPGLLGGTKSLDAGQIAQVGALLHDRMTESWFTDLDAARALFTELPAQPMAQVDVLEGGRAGNGHGDPEG